MKKAFFLVLTTMLCLALTGMAMDQSATAPGGSGAAGTPCLIATWQNLSWASQNPGTWGAHFKQTVDTDLADAAPVINTWDSSAGRSPMGNGTTNFPGASDRSGLFINRAADYQGLFGVTDEAAIGNIGLIDERIAEAAHVARLVGEMRYGNVPHGPAPEPRQQSDQPPVAFDDTQTTPENNVLTASVPPATDPDGVVVRYQLVSGVSMGQLIFNPDGSYLFDPAGAFDDLAQGENIDITFTYTAIDNDGLVSNTATITITITGVNQPPVAPDSTGSTNADTVLSGNLTPATDVDASDTLTVIATSGTGTNGGAFTINSNFTYTFDPLNHFNDLAAGQTRTTSITYTVSDNHGATDTATLTITVTGVAGSQA